MTVQADNVPANWADRSLLKMLTGCMPTTDTASGVKNFAGWYLEYYNV